MSIVYTNHYPSPLGNITLASDGKALAGLWFEGQKYYAYNIADDEQKEETLPIFSETAKWLDAYFNGNDPGFTPPLLFETTHFRKMVWEILLTIPYGTTTTYGEIAERIAKHKGQSVISAQAIGGAVGHNTISLIVPCHRVLGADGSLTGYAGGIERKVWLLTHEGIKI